MSFEKLPQWRDRQTLLYDDKKTTSFVKLINIADVAFKEGIIQDALLYYQRAKHQEGLLKIKAYAITEGDFFTLNAFSNDIQTSEWSTLAQNAEKSGKLLFALQAYEKIKDTANIERLKKLLGHDSLAIEPEESA